MNSVVARCHGTERLPNASLTTRSAESVGLVADPDAGVADPHPQVGPRLQPELLPPDLQHLGVDLEHRALRARVLGAQVAGEREPTAADVERVERPVVGELRGDDVGERLHVGELQVGRVGEIDVAVPEVVEPQRAPGRVGEVAFDVDAVVGALDVARRRCLRRDVNAGGAEHSDRDHDGAVAGAPATA